MNKMLTTTLPEEQLTALQQLADSQHRPVEAVVADAVAAYLARHEDVIEAQLAAARQIMQQRSTVLHELAK